MRIEVSIAKGTISVPSSKSYAHRMLIGGALTNKEVIIENVDLNDDILATIECLEALGKKIEINNRQLKITTVLPYEQLKQPVILNCHESGSTLRFLIPIVLALGLEAKFIGSKKLISRGISVYENICKEQKIDYAIEEESIYFNGKLKPCALKIPGNISSQFISGLLFAFPLLETQSIMAVKRPFESKNYCLMTQDVLSKLGIKTQELENIYFVDGMQTYKPCNFICEPDQSNQSFIDAFNYLCGNVEITNRIDNSLQGDFVYKTYFENLKQPNQVIDLQNCIDLGPILFVMAALNKGAKFINIERLRIKESDRVSELLEELEKFGVKYHLKENELEIFESPLHKPSTLEGHNDHRIVMALSVMLSKFGGTINGSECVKKSYPNFFEDLMKIGIEVYNE